MTLLILVLYTFLCVTVHCVWGGHDSVNCPVYLYYQGVEVRSEKDDLCTYNVSGPLIEENCYKNKYELHAPECKALHFPTYGTHSLSNFTIHRGYDSSPILKFHNVEWQYIQYRIQDVGTGDKNLCREFGIGKSVSALNLSLSCRYTLKDDRNMEMYISTGNSKTELYESGHFLIHLPHEEPLFGNWRPFIIMDITYPPTIKVIWEPAPKSFNVTSYMIKIVPTYQNCSHKEKEISASDCKEKCEVDFTLYDRACKFEVHLKVEHPSCTELCLMRSASFILSDTSSLDWLIAIPVVLVLALLIGGVFYWRSLITECVTRCYHSQGKKGAKLASDSHFSHPAESSREPYHRKYTENTDDCRSTQDTCESAANQIPYHSGWLQAYQNTKSEREDLPFNLDDLPL